MSLLSLQESCNQLYPLITAELLDQSAKRYNNDEFSLKQLDDWKNSRLPKLLADRYNSKKTTYLTKDELVLLMDWKLAKGKFRPTLPKLIKSNSLEDVAAVTKAGLSTFLTDTEKLGPMKDWSPETFDNYRQTTRSAFNKLCELKGVGPATASLVLSLLNQVSKCAPPFFSDESFMYLVMEPLRPGTAIKYTPKEYFQELLPVYYTIVKKTGFSCDEIEKGAWALKMYDIHRITALGDVKVPFEHDDFEKASYDEEELQSIKERSEIKKEKKSPIKKEPKRKAKEEKEDGKKKHKSK